MHDLSMKMTPELLEKMKQLMIENYRRNGFEPPDTFTLFASSDMVEQLKDVVNDPQITLTPIEQDEP